MTQRISGPRGRAGSRIARRTRRPGRVVGAICGVLAAAVAIGIAQLLAGLSIPAASPVIAVGQAAIDLMNAKYRTELTADFLDPAQNATIGIRPQRVFSMLHGDFTGSPTRWVFDDEE